MNRFRFIVTMVLMILALASAIVWSESATGVVRFEDCTGVVRYEDGQSDFCSGEQ